MKIEIDKKNFEDACREVSRYAEKKSNIPIITTMEIRMHNTGIVRLRATDLETACTMHRAGEIVNPTPEDEDVSVYVDPKKFLSSLRTIKEEKITLEVIPGISVPAMCPHCKSEDFQNPDPDAIEPELPFNQSKCYKCGKVSLWENFLSKHTPPALALGEFFRISTSGSESEYPEPPDRPENTELVAETRVEHLSRILKASTNEGNQGFKLDGVYFDGKAGKMVATDGHRLHLADCPSSHSFMLSADTVKKIIAGRKPMDEILIWFEKKTGNTGENEFGNVAYINGKICARVIDVMFPNYAALTDKIGEESYQHVEVDPRKLLEAINQSQSLSREMPVKMSLNGGIDISAGVEDGDSYNRQNVPIISGKIDPPMQIGFNGHFIREILNFFPEVPTIRMSVKDEHSPMFISTNEFTGLVMPLRV